MIQFLHPEGRAWLNDHLVNQHGETSGHIDASMVIAHEMAHGNKTHAQAMKTKIVYHGLESTPHDAIRVFQIHQGGIELREGWSRLAKEVHV